MQHRYVATTLGLFALGWLGLAGEAYAASPVGYWLKEDGAAKLQISQCGRNQLCSKIVWLRDPLNDKGQPLHDARNENPSLRNRTIIGLPIFQGLVPASANTWKGQIYNPEDGGTYKATLTLASSNQIILKGCMAMFLCGQKTWTRTEFNAEPEEPKQIEVKEETEEPAQPEQVVAAAEEPEAKAEAPRPMQASLGGMPSGLTSSRSTETAQVKARELDPAMPPAHRDATAGYGFVLTTASPEAAPELGTASPSRMYLMSPNPRPIEVKAASAEPTGSIATRQTATAYNETGQQTASASGPTMSQAATADATGMAAIESEETVPMPNQRPPEIDAYAEADALANQDHLSWRDRRRLRKLRRELPWLGGQEASTQGAAYQAYR
ncbi:hypothetical protein A7A08_00693 [Methyloligella halotolerans]|uniref:DUF2147 domain-containing protein n=1 Tax=Methyloligella halotolerans TaxID=1177755 RepID=A0A1E2S3E9_9HYPH|nr:DUF2147 domain-containing protein [Methyloligella halotolerans]ODA68859.1 hypothetical protein A7A08_00693 [Methyloligella halotolerans]